MQWKAIHLALVLAVAAEPAFANSPINTLAAFNVTNGDDPTGAMALSGNTLYGTTYLGGNLSLNNGFGGGVVFSVPATGGIPTPLATFNGTDGQGPQGGLTLSSNTLYGTTNKGGAHGFGEVFSLPLTGGTPTLLGSFNGSTGGSEPTAGVTISGNTLYGTAGGGANNGVVYSLPLTGGTPTVLATFNGTNGSGPSCGLTLSGNTLYGTTTNGGNLSLDNGDGEGVVFSVPATGGTPTVLATFNGTDGFGPQGNLLLVGNTLYGTTIYGGNMSLNSHFGAGVVFSVPVTGGTPTVLATFENTNGCEPLAGLTLVGDTLYGTTQLGGNLNLNGGAGDGLIFSLPLTGGTPTPLVVFDGTNGEVPNSGLLLSGTTLYGTTAFGSTSANIDGTVFSIEVPEPGSLGLLATMILAMLCGRRRQRC